MKSNERPLDDLSVAGDGRGPAGFRSASGRCPRGARPRRLLCMAMVCLALAGCSVLAPWSTRHHTAITKSAPPRKEAPEKKPRLGSWFRAEEPRPPESVKEWLDLEPIRP